MGKTLQAQGVALWALYFVGVVKVEEKDDVELRLVSLERKLWALLMQHANRRELAVVREMLELIEAVEQI